MVTCRRCNVEMEYISVCAGIETQKGFITIFYGDKLYRCPKCNIDKYVVDYRAVDWR